MANILNVPHYSQKIDGWCLPACVQMALAYLGIFCSQDDLANRLGTRLHVGTPHRHITRLESVEVSVFYAADGTAAILHHYVVHHLSVMVFVQTSELPHWHTHVSRHTLVAVGIDDDSVSVLDPGASPELVRIPLGDFLLAWEEMDTSYAVLSRHP